MDTLYHYLLLLVLIASPIIFISALFVTAPYGRHHREGWGLSIDNRWAWFWMELPAVLTILILYLINCDSISWINIVFLLIWEIHYVYRTFYYPFQLRSVNKTFPISLIFSAVFFNMVNGYINGYFLFHIRPLEDISWFYTPTFWIGMVLFISGYLLHIDSDKRIINIRHAKPGIYAIPQGGGFRYITNPNYFGEFIQWTGWAILTWSIAGLSFAIFTMANLLPRAIANHRWYKEKFDDYPSNRKRFFPFLY